MTELALPGCRTTPLGGYLAGLGLLRAVTRLRDGEATGRWERQPSARMRRARAVAARARPPLPLVDSPKCPRCSLVGLCLPDETNALLSRREQPPRRLVPRDPDQRPVYVTEPGSFVGVRSGRLEVTLKKEKLASWRLLDVAQLAVFGRVQIST